MDVRRFSTEQRQVILAGELMLNASPRTSEVNDWRYDQ
jgi:hypothetical protein